MDECFFWYRLTRVDRAVKRLYVCVLGSHRCILVPSVLSDFSALMLLVRWQEDIQLIKKLSDEVLAWLLVWSEVK